MGGRCHTVLHEEDASAGKVETLAGLIKFPIYRGLEQFGVQVNLAVWISELWQLVGCVAIRLDPTEKYVCWQQEDNCLIVPQSALNSKRKAQLSVHSKVGIESRSGSSVDILWLDIPESDLAPVAIEDRRKKTKKEEEGKKKAKKKAKNKDEKKERKRTRQEK